LETIAPDFMGEIIFFYRVKAEFSEKSRLIGEGKNPTDLQAPCLVKAGIHQRPADTPAPVLLRNGQRAYLRQIFPADMERAGSLNTVVVKDDKVAQLVIQRADGPAQQQALGGEALQEAMDIFHIAHPGRTDRNFSSARCAVASAICCTRRHHDVPKESLLPTKREGAFLHAVFLHAVQVFKILSGYLFRHLWSRGIFFLRDIREVCFLFGLRPLIERRFGGRNPLFSLSGLDTDRRVLLGKVDAARRSLPVGLFCRQNGGTGRYDCPAGPYSQKEHPEKEAEGGQSYPGDTAQGEVKGEIFGRCFLCGRGCSFSLRHSELNNLNYIRAV